MHRSQISIGKKIGSLYIVDLLLRKKRPPMIVIVESVSIAASVRYKRAKITVVASELRDGKKEMQERVENGYLNSIFKCTL